MKFLSTFSVHPGCWQEAASRSLAGKGQLANGVTLLGRRRNTDLSGGFSLGVLNHTLKPMLAASVFLFLSGFIGAAQDLPGNPRFGQGGCLRALFRHG
jgi:hypothetical protein